MIEGEISAKQRVVVIEDLISTGGSSLKAVDALREKGCDVAGLIAIFSYGFQIAADNFKAANCSFTTLSNYEILIEEALRGGYVDETNLETLKNWRKQPETWGK
jgi:orotate phosphoribosyltransferase